MNNVAYLSSALKYTCTHLQRQFSPELQGPFDYELDIFVLFKEVVCTWNFIDNRQQIVHFFYHTA